MATTAAQPAPTSAPVRGRIAIEPARSTMAASRSALLALTVSFDDYVITSLVAGVDSETLPMVIYAIARRGVNPVVNAISALIVVGFGSLVLISERLRTT